MNNYKYVLLPDYIISMSDGQEHFINASQLAALYRVPLSKCRIISPNNRKAFRPQPDDILLTPRVDGNYHILTCYQCEQPTNWLAPDSRCGDCTRLTPSEIKGE